MDSLMDHMPTGGIPHVLPVAFRHWLPFPGLRMMPNTVGKGDHLQFSQI